MSITNYAPGFNILDTEKINDIAKNITECNVDSGSNKKM